jgi:PPOX class probable F420-dependent enzyme
MADGAPQTSPVWVDVDGDVVTFSTKEGRLKPKNLRRDPRIALSAVDPDNPERQLLVRGRVTEITTDGADEQADQLAKKYMGLDKYPYDQPGDVRLRVRVEPDRVMMRG